MNKLPAGTGMLWLKQGFNLFRQQPGMLTMLLFSNLLFAVLLSALPLVGQILSMVFIPSFSMAILQACQQIEAGGRVQPAVLLTGFRKDVIGPLCKLGSVYFALAVLLFLAVSPWIDFEAFREATKASAGGKPPVIDPTTSGAVVSFVILYGLAIVALSFAPPLTYWKKMPTFKAIFYSVFAILGSFGPVVVMLLTWVGIYFGIGLVLGAVLGRSQILFVVMIWMNLIFTLILQCAIYAAYRQLLPDAGQEKL